MDNFVADAIFVDAPSSRVFSAIVDPDDVLVWMDAESVAIDPRVGGEFTARRTDGSTVSGVISALEPGERIEISEYSHETGGQIRGPMVVRFHLEPRDSGVWLTVRQEGLDRGKDWQTFALATRRELVRATVALKRHIEQI